MSEKELIIRCKKHNEKYDANQGRCPKCMADVSAFEYLKIRLTCRLCDEIKASVKIYAGGPIDRMCDDCHAIIVKWEESKDALDEFWKKRNYEVDSQLFFRKIFDNDPVEFIWG